MLIDAHCHVWRIGQNDHEWPTPDLPAIHRDFGLDNLRQAGSESGPDGVVLVQSQPSERDTEWLLDLAAADPLALGVVGWTDVAAADAPARIARLAANPWLKGLRPMLQDLSDDWILQPEVQPAIAAMIDADLAFDALVKPRHLPSLATFARRWPQLRIVIDHGAKPPIAAGSLEPWLSDLRALAALPNVCCKLSGLLTEAGDAPSLEAVSPYARAVLELFAPERLMWGSDWPVLNLASAYDAWLADCRALTQDWPAEHLASLFGETAKRFYRL